MRRRALFQASHDAPRRRSSAASRPGGGWRGDPAVRRVPGSSLPAPQRSAIRAPRRPMIGASLPGMRRMAQGRPSERGVHRGRNDRAPPPDRSRRAARRAGVSRQRPLCQVHGYCFDARSCFAREGEGDREAACRWFCRRVLLVALACESTPLPA